MAAGEPASEQPADQVDGAGAAPTSEYPSLHTVPPRPRLSYSVQQSRAIVDGLVADRENARYTDQVVRYRSGQSGQPPPPAPPTTVAAAVPEDVVEPARTEAASDEPVDPGPSYADDDDQVFEQQYDDDTLSDFVDELARDTAEEPLGAPGPAGSDPEGADGDGPGWFDWLGGLFGQTETEAADPIGAVAAAPAAGPEATAPPIRPVDDDTSEASIQAAWRKEAAPALRPGAAGERIDQTEAPSPAAEPLPAAARAAQPDPDAAGIVIGNSGVAIGEGLATVEADQAPPEEAPRSILVRFEPGSASLPAGSGSRLEQVLATARAQGAAIRIEGEAEVPALALDRAHAVALGLMRLGAHARDLEMALAPEATGDQARVVVTGPAAR